MDRRKAPKGGTKLQLMQRIAQIAYNAKRDVRIRLRNGKRKAGIITEVNDVNIVLNTGEMVEFDKMDFWERK